ncbi:hypothetical protein VTN77DRAFT_394 [Rasamsonia byssochlamydoides]|uniref:uncharacterized protein n=1 Tax=Rasamsonia byssochlamydoides TaxID=89139 RepID=UPI003741FCE4
MSMTSVVPFEDGINAESLVRRLKNVQRKRGKMEKKNAKKQPENKRLTTDSSEPHLQSTSSTPGEEQESLQEPTDSGHHSLCLDGSDDNVIAPAFPEGRQDDLEQPRKGDNEGFAEAAESLEDPNASIEENQEEGELPRSASSIHSSKNSYVMNAIVLPDDPNVKHVPANPDDPDIRSHPSVLREEEEMKRRRKQPFLQR